VSPKGENFEVLASENAFFLREPVFLPPPQQSDDLHWRTGILFSISKKLTFPIEILKSIKGNHESGLRFQFSWEIHGFSALLQLNLGDLPGKIVFSVLSQDSFMSDLKNRLLQQQLPNRPLIFQRGVFIDEVFLSM